MIKRVLFLYKFLLIEYVCAIKRICIGRDGAKVDWHMSSAICVKLKIRCRKLACTICHLHPGREQNLV